MLEVRKQQGNTRGTMYDEGTKLIVKLQNE